MFSLIMEQLYRSASNIIWGTVHTFIFIIYKFLSNFVKTILPQK